MRICCVLSCSASFFDQAKASIDTIRVARGVITNAEIDIAIVGIDHTPDQTAYFKSIGVTTYDKLDDFPLYDGAPRYMYASTCRPYVPEFLPGYDGYIWVDSDVRFLYPGGLQYYVNALAPGRASVIAVQETEPCYSLNRDPKVARVYHSVFAKRLAAVYGDDVAEYCRYFTPFNAGLFAAPAGSPFWTRYRRNLHKAMRVPYDFMLEQDALNIAIQEVGGEVRAPSTVNWLCSLAMPMRRPDGMWCNPENTADPIYVAHLTNSEVPIEGGTYYDFYKHVGLTA